MQSPAVQSYHTQPTEQYGSHIDPTTDPTFGQQNAKIAKLHMGITACIGTTAASTVSFGASQCIAALSSPKAQIACGGIAMFSLVFGLVLSRFALKELKNTQIDLEKQHTALDDRENALADWKTALAIRDMQLDDEQKGLEELKVIQEIQFKKQQEKLEKARTALKEERKKKHEEWQKRQQQGPLESPTSIISGVSYSCTCQVEHFTQLSNPQGYPTPPATSRTYTFPLHV